MKKQLQLILFALAVSLLLALTLGQALVFARGERAPSSPNADLNTQLWYSGWVNIAPGQTLTLNHNLGLAPEAMWVEVWFKDADGRAGINRIGYGGIEASGSWFGAYWHHFTANNIQITRLPNDKAVDQVFVKVWKIETPDYDSGWMDFSIGNTAIHHNLGITNTDLLAAIWFSGTTKGIHNYGYGTLTVGTEEHGGFWMKLTDNNLEVYRRLYDEDAEQVRVVVTRPETPDYDSLVALGDWQDMAKGSVFTFTHNLNWDPSLLMVRAECLHPDGQGINHNYAGGDVYNTLAAGYHIQNLTANSLHFVRRIYDTSCTRARIRIWKRARPIRPIYLPMLMLHPE